MNALAPLRALSVCSGIGGLDLAWEWAGGEIAGQVELDPFCQRVLARHWPDVKRLADMREVRGDEFGRVDVLMGGIPCQPHSVAGKRRAGADERDLWPEYRRLLCAMGARWGVVENVAGLLSSRDAVGRRGGFFGAILSDLAALGFDACWGVWAAADVGAPHRRERVWLIAHRRDSGDGGRTLADAARQRAREPHDPSHPLTDSRDARAVSGRGGQPERLADRDGERQPQSRRRLPQGGRRAEYGGGDVADAAPGGLRRRPAPGQGGQPSQSGERGRGRVAVAGGAGYAERDGLDGDGPQPTTAGGRGRQAQSAVGRDVDGLPGGLDRASLGDGAGGRIWRGEWPAGPDAPQYEWEPPRTHTNRLPERAERLKALGNAVVPAQAYPLCVALMAADRAERAGLGERGERGA